MQFTSFVSQDDQDTFAAHCRRTREEQPVQTAEIKLNGPENTILNRPPPEPLPMTRQHHDQR